MIGRKQLNEDLNHTGFLAIVEPPEEVIEIKETFTLKEAMNSNHKPQFIHATEK